MYKHVESEHIFICGDFNVRIGTCVDTLSDELPVRKVLDETINQQGWRLAQFVSDIKGCIINGRVTLCHDYYTSVAPHKGWAVVDYHLTRISDLDSVQSMEVVSCVDLVGTNQWQYLLKDRCRLPDHNLLTMKVETSAVVTRRLLDQNLGSKEAHRQKVRCKVGEEYMESDVAK